MTYDVLIIGAGISGATLAYKISKYAKTLLIEARDKIPSNTNIFAKHNQQFIDNKDWSSKTIFPCDHIKTNYMGEKANGVINSKEFGEPLGKVSHTESLINSLLEKSQDNGGTVKFGEKISKINKDHNGVELLTNKGTSYKGKLVAIATGSHSFELQRSIGFKSPSSYYGIFTHLYGDEEKINENLEYDYIFHVNQSISKNGPFFINRGKGRVSLGFLGNLEETPEKLVSKFNRIITNYDRIQPFIKGLKANSRPVVGFISKHPIKEFSKDRAIVLGEAAGLVTAFFYEGMLGGMASATFAANTLKPLIENNSNFSQSDLSKYDKEIHRFLLKNYFRNGKASEHLFYGSGSHLKRLWEIYATLIGTNKTVRKYIYDAYRWEDLANYDTKRDRYVGEKMFAMLPTFTKIALGPRFFKAMLK